ncbi:hypothetical protein DICPUDRAFT_91466 [Dictyostelium purpureum]|uniref:Nascent polypeptide-associated complex subunit beta n=1 Tax=Dictyostelium purpureum TaxID=5786 RepID=F0ZCV8_DICPU|nr:uncharacterized protein DICPUDRAFT_91466 [Dictyostelium purpureum]EGC38229.1 hypothetical protein DICPUDRAFT_91466 [Dictyostelium purpureum]|eukprot:XP_003285267.1 hypothetical protein DICPUDRAFT_91466 [Dictyostelium purpureum]
MDAEIARLNKLAEERVRTGGKGSMRRKQQVVHKSSTSVDDKKILQKLNFKTRPIEQIEEANLFKNDGNIIHFKNPRVNAAPNTFIISGHNEVKPMASIPHVITQLGAENLNQIRKMAEAFKAADKDITADDIPELVENFDSKQ